MSLPTSRSTTYVPGSTPAVKAQDLDDLQDYLSGLLNAALSLKKVRLDGTGEQAVAPSALIELLGSNNIAQPSLVGFNAANKARWFLDHNGYPTGKTWDQFREQWLTTGSSLSGAIPGSTAGFTASPGAGGSYVVTDPTASYNSKFLTVTPSTSSGAADALYTPTFCWSTTAGMSLVLEMDIGHNAAAVGTASKVTFYYGFSAASDIIGSADNNILTLLKRHNQANYQTAIGNGTLVGFGNLGTPVAPTAGANPVDRLKIELHGSSSPLGAYTALFYINEVLVQTVTSGLPGAVAFRALAYAYSEGGVPVGSPIGYIGPVTATWNRYASQAAF